MALETSIKRSGLDLVRNQFMAMELVLPTSRVTPSSNEGRRGKSRRSRSKSAQGQLPAEAAVPPHGACGGMREAAIEANFRRPCQDGELTAAHVCLYVSPDAVPLRELPHHPIRHPA